MAAVALIDVASVPPGNSAEVVADGRIFAVFNVDGTFHVLDGICPHAGGPLGKGMLRGNIVTCPCTAGSSTSAPDSIASTSASARLSTTPESKTEKSSPKSVDAHCCGDRCFAMFYDPTTGVSAGCPLLTVQEYPSCAGKSGSRTGT